MPLDEAALELLRRNSHLAVDREGRLRHEGELVAHPRVAALFLAGLDVDARGEAIVHVGPQWAYVACERTPFVVWRARIDGAAGVLQLRLNTGEELALPAAATRLRLEGETDLFVAIHGGRHEARFGRQAWAALGEALDVDADGRLRLDVGGVAVLVAVA